MDLTLDTQLVLQQKKEQTNPLNYVPLVFSFLSDLKDIKLFLVKTEKTVD